VDEAERAHQLVLHASAAAAKTRVLDACDAAIASLESRLASLPLPSAAQAVVDQVAAEIGGAGGGEMGDGEGVAGARHLSAAQADKLKESVAAALLMHALNDVNVRLGFIGANLGGVCGVAARVVHYQHLSMLLLHDAMCSPAFGAAGARAAEIVSDAESAPRQVLRHAVWL